MIDDALKSFAERLVRLADDSKEDVKSVIEEAKAAGKDTAGLRRLASWMRRDETARLEQEAVDEQYRFLVGLRATPAELPTEGQLATAAALYADKLSVRDVAAKMGISVGKAHQLKIKSEAFAVHVNMNKAPVSSHRPMVADDIGEWLPTHDAETGELLREMCDADLGDYALIKPRVRVERPKKPEEDFGAKVRRMIADAGLKPQTERDRFISDDEANRALEEALSLRVRRQEVTV